MTSLTRSDSIRLQPSWTFNDPAHGSLTLTAWVTYLEDEDPTADGIDDHTVVEVYGVDGGGWRVAHLDMDGQTGMITGEGWSGHEEGMLDALEAAPPEVRPELEAVLHGTAVGRILGQRWEDAPVH